MCACIGSSPYWLSSQSTRKLGRAAFVACASALAFCSAQSQAQSLNQVVSQLLKVGPSGIACEGLLGNELASDVLVGPLAGPTLCSRFTPQAAAVSSEVTGGDAATPTSMPGIVARRLREGKEDGNSGSTGASTDRTADLGGGVTAFMSGEYERLNRDVSTFEDGYRSRVNSLTAGLDKQLTQQFLAGLAINYSHQKGEFVSAGNFSNSSYGLLGYASLTPIKDLFVQITAGYARKEYSQKRFATFTESENASAVELTRVTGFEDNDYRGSDYSAGILAGYDFKFSSVSVGPRAGLSWVRSEYDSHSERGDSGLELRFGEDRRTSFRSNVGVIASRAFGTTFGVVVPQVGVDWIHEFEDDQRNISFSFLGDTRGKTFAFQNSPPDRDFLQFNAGAVFVFPKGVQAFANYRALAHNSVYSGEAFSLGMRLEF